MSHEIKVTLNGKCRERAFHNTDDWNGMMIMVIMMTFMMTMTMMTTGDCCRGHLATLSKNQTKWEI